MNIDIDPENFDTMIHHEMTVDDPTIDAATPEMEPVEEVPEESEVDDEYIPEVITLSSSNFGAFREALSILSRGASSTSVINIENGKLVMPSGSGYLYCDLTSILAETNFKIIDAQKVIQSMTWLKGGHEIKIINDTVEKKYIMSKMIDDRVDATIVVNQVQDGEIAPVVVPEVGEKILSVALDKDQIATFQDASKKTESDNFIISIDLETNTLLSISTKFKEYTKIFEKTKDGANVQDFKIYNPFPIQKVDEVVLSIHIKDDQYWATTSNASGLIEVTYTERIQVIGEFDSWSL